MYAEMVGEALFAGIKVDQTRVVARNVLLKTNNMFKKVRVERLCVSLDRLKEAINHTKEMATTLVFAPCPATTQEIIDFTKGTMQFIKNLKEQCLDLCLMYIDDKDEFAKEIHDDALRMVKDLNEIVDSCDRQLYYVQGGKQR